MQITDAQIHLWANDKAPPHHWRAPFRIEDALREMEAAGIASAINHPPNWDPESMGYAAQATVLHPDRFATLGWFPLEESTGEAEVEALMAMPGMKGMRFILAMPQTAELFAADKLDWLWAAADARALPVGLFVLPQQFHQVGQIAARFPKMRLMIDHLGVPPSVKLPQAAPIIEALIGLAPFHNIAVKATAVPGMALDGYPCASTHDLLRRTYAAYGSERFFWGTDYTRMALSWRECAEIFLRELDWLRGAELAAVMGGGVRDWIGWS